MKITTIKQNTQFRRLYYRGKKSACQAVAVYAMRNRTGGNRIGITVSTKIGNAVVRNRARRVIREGYRLVAQSLPQGYDFVFVARGKTPSLKSVQLAESIRKLVTEMKL